MIPALTNLTDFTFLAPVIRFRFPVSLSASNVKDLSAG